MKKIFMLRRIGPVSSYLMIPVTLADGLLAHRGGPLSRGKRVKRDLKQLWKDLVGHNPDTEISTAQLPHHFNNELRTVCESEPTHNTGISPRNQNEQLDGPQNGKI